MPNDKRATELYYIPREVRRMRPPMIDAPKGQRHGNGTLGLTFHEPPDGALIATERNEWGHKVACGMLPPSRLEAFRTSSDVQHVHEAAARGAFGHEYVESVLEQGNLRLNGALESAPTKILDRLQALSTTINEDMARDREPRTKLEPIYVEKTSPQNPGYLPRKSTIQLAPAGGRLIEVTALDGLPPRVRYTDAYTGRMQDGLALIQGLTTAIAFIVDQNNRMRPPAPTLDLLVETAKAVQYKMATGRWLHRWTETASEDRRERIPTSTLPLADFLTLASQNMRPAVEQNGEDPRPRPEADRSWVLDIEESPTSGASQLVQQPGRQLKLRRMPRPSREPTGLDAQMVVGGQNENAVKLLMATLTEQKATSCWGNRTSRYLSGLEESGKSC